MEYKLLAHDEYSHPDHPPAETVEVGDTVVLVFKGLEDSHLAISVVGVVDDRGIERERVNELEDPITFRAR